MRIALAIWLLVSAPAQALEYCDELWFTRNMVFDRAGYCFGSALGQSVFGNAGCTTKSPALSAADAALVDRVKRLESDWGCRVDTKRRALQIPDIRIRAGLVNLPVPTPYESACLGWLGAPVPLRLGHDQGWPEIGRIEPGDTIGYAFEPVGDWHYVIVGAYGTAQRFGWAYIPETGGQCANYAG